MQPELQVRFKVAFSQGPVLYCHNLHFCAPLTQMPLSSCWSSCIVHLDIWTTTAGDTWGAASLQTPGRWLSDCFLKRVLFRKKTFRICTRTSQTSPGAASSGLFTLCWYLHAAFCVNFYFLNFDACKWMSKVERQQLFVTKAVLFWERIHCAPAPAWRNWGNQINQIGSDPDLSQLQLNWASLDDEDIKVVVWQMAW